ncbi:MAG: polymerase sigma factor FliA [Chloroflexota bacterium]|jgi:RNA polymerase sigma factor for flagellar operon FliA|nr:polymerase sigma factor FliA [Chloroflexota bacterium]
MASTAERRKPIVLAETWRRYKRSGDQAARNQLILAYSPIVKYAAGRIASRMPAHVELADLVSYGLGGLIEAVERFEPARGIKFESYAGTRIRGAIFDELRSLDWVPRAVRLEARQIEQDTVELSSRLHRMPTEAELAAEMSIEPAALDAALQRVANARMVALDQPWDIRGADGVETSLLQTLPDPDAADPAASADAADLRDRIADAINHLPDREQLVLGLRYHQDLRLAEIGEILGVTESRISQLHAKAVLQLRALLPAD